MSCRTVRQRIPDLEPGQIAILYPAAEIGDAVAEAALRHGFGTIRTDNNALYPRSSRLLRWLEQCAVWCSSGWQSGIPRFFRLVTEGRRIFAEALVTDEQQRTFQRNLILLLWARRDSQINLHRWHCDMHDGLISALVGDSRSLNDEAATLGAFITRTGANGDAADMTLGLFSGFGGGNDRINLSTLHSAKGREFSVVVLFAMDEGRIPWNNVSASERQESRRLFYVGFTQAKHEIHMIFTVGRPSPFVHEVQQRLEQRSDLAA